MRRITDWLFKAIAFYFKLFVFLVVLLLLFLFGAVHAALFGGPVMPDDAWFIFKIVLLLVLPLALSIVTRRWAFLAAGFAISILLAAIGFVSLSNYAHAPSFWTPKPYEVVGGKLFVPEDKRDELLRDCGLFESRKLRDSCELVIYCQEYDSAAYERMGCEELLTRKTSAALLDMTLDERKRFEDEQRKRGE
jgi:hypothetical protein